MQNAYLALASPSRIRRVASRRAFTLVELLVVVLILAILMAVALPLYLGAIHNSARRTARANLKTIINAEMSYRAQNPGFGFTDDKNKLLAPTGPLTAWPEGPGNTKYTIYTQGGLPDGSRVQRGGVAACAKDATTPEGDYGCYQSGDSE